MYPRWMLVNSIPFKLGWLLIIDYWLYNTNQSTDGKNKLWNFCVEDFLLFMHIN